MQTQIKTPHVLRRDVLVIINEACCLLECVFRNGVSERMLAGINAKYKGKSGYSVTYGVNTVGGGEDKSVLRVHYNRIVNYREAAEELEALLFGIVTITWKRDIDYGTKTSNVLAEVC